MAEKKKLKQRKLEEEKPTKEEYAVAKFLRFNLPSREGKLHGMEVHCFFGNAAVDKLLESKWSAAKNAKEPLFTNRMSCVAYLVRLLEKGLFHRAERDKRKKDKDEKDKGKKKKKDREEKEEGTVEEEVRERKGKKDKKGKKEVEAIEESAEQKAEAEKKTEKKDEKKKKEKRLRLVMPDQQFFEDSDEVYVWIYDPVKAKNFFIGLLMVLGAIALCMFPLWPPEVRIGVYYISLSAAGFVGFILSLVVVRLILFCCIWILTLGRHHFWFLPNLTEDVGFFDSFKPLYKHDYVPKEDNQKAIQDSDKKRKKGKNADKDTTDKKEKSSDKDDSDEFEVIKKEDLVDNGADEDKDLDEGEDAEDPDNDEDENEDNGVDDDEEDEEENIETDDEKEDIGDTSETTDTKKTK
ncbi:translocation protein sec62 [Plakobranchus ocellatus]|uniref:Translocation protein SEC62 n=1 Tax=Plakobranchus ocellatus TaxID=259542 RepID=A0AAV3ZAU8_9GAST|nr:translocation protein sec62 [Plakobranchus ocellatus]